jgi:citrate lyase beta subunit
VPPDLPGRLDALLAGVDAVGVPARVPAGRQPVHTAYVPADAFRAGTPSEWGDLARTALDRHAPEAGDLGVTEDVRARVLDKLSREPVEDVRIDFEDGYGDRPDDQEDSDARAAGAALGEAVAAAPALGCGIRAKGLEARSRARALRTLDLVLSGCGGVPAGFVLTVPKVTAPEQVVAARELCEAVGRTSGGPPMRFEVQVETPQAVARIREIASAAGPACAGLHYGTYDYSAALGVAAAHQALDHPVADHAKDLLQVAAAVHGLRVVDGSSNVLPVGSTAEVRAAWSLHAALVRRSLVRGIYQGWDLHGAQLVSRYAAVFSFYRDGLDAAGARLRGYLDRVAGGVLDEPATARALAGYLVRGLDCGAVGEDEVRSAAGLDRSGLTPFVR